MSVDQHLRLFTFLQRLEFSSITQEKLALLLTPLLANNPEGQKEIFTWVQEAVVLEEETEKPDNLPKSNAPEEEASKEGSEARTDQARPFR
ncbi:MAG: hypothetical protein IPN20_03590 [Haliscomenobacter sp.]|nr:hypothetical protein [Haliscomenobacter sp.]